ncbi:MAG: Flp family type IVb pilin [Alphaproteobacteria bacterium]|nr:MAG: Flp family type IVb pilin [Alphaproteobacteria bacterium]TAF77334.1 MAG: Flp family type IVb pilin [Alphaproteobacteria bacterium]
MMKHLKNLIKDESGATAIEYALIAALVAVGIILALQGVRTQLNELFNRISTELASARAQG